MTVLALPDSDFLPAPLWMLNVLHLLTLCLHVVAMNCLLGGLLTVLFGPFPNRWEHPLVRRIVGIFPGVMAATVTLGVAPLLFAQLVYGSQLYAASIISGWFWIGIPAAAMVSYYCFYAARSAAATAARTRGLLLVALAGLVYISLTYSSVFSLAERPEARAQLYAEDQSGLVWNPAVGVWILRWLHMVTGALMVGGFFVALLGRKDPASWKAGLRVFLTGAVLAAATGVGYLLTLTGADELKPFMRSAGIWWLTAGIVLALGALHFAFRRRVVPAGLLLFLSLAGMVVTRHTLRLLRLEGHFDPSETRVEPQWTVFVLFLVCFVAGLAVVVYMVRLYLRDRQPVGAP